MRERALLHAGEEHDGVFQALGGVQSHQRDLAGVLALGGQLVGVRHQRRGLQECGQRGVRRVLFEFGGDGLQLRQVLHTGGILWILGPLQFFEQTGLREHLPHHFGRLAVMFGRERAQGAHQVPECGELLAGAGGHAVDLVEMVDAVPERGRMSIGI